MIVEALVLIIFPGLLAYAAATDLLTMTIPNRVSLGLVAGFAVLAIATAMPLALLGVHVATGFGMLALCFCLYSFGYVGGGDAKLLASVALWFGWADLLPFILMTALFGGGLAMALLAVRRIPLPAGLSRMPWIVRLHTQGEGTPYGLAIAAGALEIYPHTHWMALAA